MSFRRRPYRLPQSSRGVGLIEVLIAVLVMAIGLLGIAALQATALRNSQSAFERSQAVVQTYAILDAMRANPTAVAAGSYNLAKTCTAPTAPASTAGLVSWDQYNWLSSLKGAMGDSTCGQIACASNVCTITVHWNDSRGTGDSTALQAYSISTKTRI